MSHQQEYEIRCPTCSQEQSVRLYDTVNVADGPALRDDLLANRLNAVACQACGFTFRVDKPLLYNDPARRLLIYLFPPAAGPREMGEKQFETLVSGWASIVSAETAAPGFHFVTSRVELVERIFLLEAGLDARRIEYIKYLIYSRNPARLDPASRELLFNAQDSTDENLCFVVRNTESGRLESMLQFPRPAYDSLGEVLDTDKGPASLSALFPGPRISARDLLLAD